MDSKFDYIIQNENPPFLPLVVSIARDPPQLDPYMVIKTRVISAFENRGPVAGPKLREKTVQCNHDRVKGAVNEYVRFMLTVFDKNTDLDKLTEAADRIAEIQHPPAIATV